MKEITITSCDFSNPVHLKKLVQLMNEYINDDMGGGESIQGTKETAFINGLKNHPSKLILFALYQQEYAGLANCFINFSTFAAKPYINIHDFVVHKDFRGKHVGKNLMQGILDRAREMDCAKVNLEVREDNHIAQGLYRQFGFEAGTPKMLFWQLYF